MIDDDVERARFLASLRAAALEPGQQGPRRRDPAGGLLRRAAVGPGLRRPARGPDRGDHADVARGARARDRGARRSGGPRRRAAAARRDDRRRRRSAGRAPAAAVRAHRARRARRRPARSPSTPTGASAGSPARSRGGRRQLFEPMNERGRDACRQLFLRLVTLGEGTEDTRRRVRRSELATLADPQTMDAVIETFGRHRLLSFDRDPDTREPTVEIAHEALLREWARLRGWIDDAREDLRQRARISSATDGMDPGGPKLWTTSCRGSGSRRPRRRREATRFASRTNEREFLDASVAHSDAGGGRRADAPRARAHPRAASPHAPSRTGRRAGGGAGPGRLADGRLRRQESRGRTTARRIHDRRRSRRPPCRTSTPTRDRASSWRCMP